MQLKPLRAQKACMYMQSFQILHNTEKKKVMNKAKNLDNIPRTSLYKVPAKAC